MLPSVKTLGAVALGSVRDWRRQQRVTTEVVLRMLADAIMLNVALAVGLLIRSYWAVSVLGSAESTRARISDFVAAYLSTFWLLTAICLVVFYLAGFYSYSRGYRGRYKALVVARSVSLGYLVFGFSLFLLDGLIPFPRSVILLAWLFSLLAVGGARLWVWVWWVSGGRDQRVAAAQPGKRPVHNVLVVGGAGYIGSALTGKLLALGYYVRVLDALVYGDDSIAAYYRHPRFELIRGDFCHIDTVVMAVQGMDAVVHLGAIVGDAACQVCEEVTLEINLTATRTIAEVAKGYGVTRFVFASTCSVYGASSELLDERSALKPLSLYARTKVASEQVLLSLGTEAFAPTIMRFGTIYGLSGRPRFDLVVNLLTAKAVCDGEAGIVGGKQWRPLVHVKDVAEALVLTLRAPVDVVRGQTFNVGSNEQNYQIADIGNLIKEMVPTARIVTQASEDDRDYRVRFDKIHQMLGFEPRYTVRDGIAEVADALQRGIIADYRDPRYNNTTYLSQHNELRQAVMAYKAAKEQIASLAM